jgi:hypothetical protein
MRRRHGPGSHPTRGQVVSHGARENPDHRPEQPEAAGSRHLHLGRVDPSSGCSRSHLEEVPEGKSQETAGWFPC